MKEKDYEKEVLKAIRVWLLQKKGYITKDLACSVEQYLKENNCNAPNPTLRVTYRMNACSRIIRLCNSLYENKEMYLIETTLAQIAHSDY